MVIAFLICGFRCLVGVFKVFACSFIEGFTEKLKNVKEIYEQYKLEHDYLI